MHRKFHGTFRHALVVLLRERLCFLVTLHIEGALAECSAHIAFLVVYRHLRECLALARVHELRSGAVVHETSCAADGAASESVGSVQERL